MKDPTSQSCHAILEDFLDRSGNLLMLTMTSDGTISRCSRGVSKHFPGVRIQPGDRIEEHFQSHDGEPFTLAECPLGEQPCRALITLRLARAPYACMLYRTDDGCVLLGERVEVSDNEVIESMSLLTNELANVTREVRKKNRELEEANRTIHELMRTDPLTGLPNRRHFNEVLDKAISQANRQQMPLSLLMTDIDKFKSINDTYGHDGGDVVLKEFAAVLRDSIRHEDTAGRYGGEEFLILLPGIEGSDAFQAAERIREAVAARDMLGDGRKVTASFGCTQFQPGEAVESFLKRVDTALYEAKGTGRNKTIAEWPQAATDANTDTVSQARP